MIRFSGRARVLALVLATALAGLGATAPSAQARPGGPAAQRPAVSATRATDALERAQLLFHGTRWQARRVQRHQDATLVLRALRAAYPSLSPAQKRQADRLLARPAAVADGSHDPVYAVRPSVECGASICVHYDLATRDATNGVDPTDADHNHFPDYVDTVLATLEHVRATYVAAGYRAPLDDTASPNNGGNADTDIYLAQLAVHDLYGYCTSDDPRLTDETTFYSYASAYCVLDNDYTDSIFTSETPLQNLEVTAAHEFFHAVQFAYDYYEDTWIMEATATWAEDELYTDINDNVQYLHNSPLRRPGTPIDASGMHWYGTWIFFRFLTEHVDPARDSNDVMPVLIRDIWRRLDANRAAAPAAPDEYSIQAVKRALSAHGIDLTTAVTEFDLAARHPRKYFSEAAANNYPRAPIAVSATLGPGRPHFATEFGLRHLSYRVLRLTPRAGMGSAWHLRLRLALPPTTHGSAAGLWITGRDGATSARILTLPPSGDRIINLPFSASTVDTIEVEVINASTRFRSSDCWPTAAAATYYSCSAARGADDGLRQAVTATAYRG